MQDTFKAKSSFEAVFRRSGMSVLHYHVDNDHFTEKSFLKKIVNNDQTISFCGAYKYFQNGKAEKRI